MSADRGVSLEDDAALEAWIKTLFPDDGVLVMRTFSIPKKARSYEVREGSSRTVIPLRNEPGDIRAGIAVYDYALKPLMVNVIEAKAGVLVDELRPDALYCIAVMIQQATSEGFENG